MNTTQLIEIARADDRWADCAQGIVNEGRDIDEIVREEGENLKASVLAGFTTLDELRAGLQWASALDRESVERYGACLTDGDQLLERTSRRLMHGAGRLALNSLKSKRRRYIAYAETRPSLGRIGMGRTETHDIHDMNSQDLVQ